MATFRFELNGRPTKNKTYVVYLRVTVGGKRKLIKTMVEIGDTAKLPWMNFSDSAKNA